MPNIFRKLPNLSDIGVKIQENPGKAMLFIVVIFVLVFVIAEVSCG